MHRVIAGCNMWALLFLGAAFVLGMQQSAHHFAVGMFAAIFALFAQCVNFALFMGASKLLKEHVMLYKLPESFMERNNQLLFRLLPWAFAGSLTVLVFGIVAGLGLSGDVPVLVHVVIGILSIAVICAAVGPEVSVFRDLHTLLADMEAEIPEQRASELTDPDQPDPVVLRGRALVYVGGTALTLVLGYRYISGIRVPATLFGLVIGFSIACFLLAIYLRSSAEKTSRDV